MVVCEKNCPASSCGSPGLLGAGPAGSAFVCNYSCINKSLVLALVFMGFTEKLSFQEDKNLHLQLCYCILLTPKSKTLNHLIRLMGEKKIYGRQM